MAISQKFSKSYRKINALQSTPIDWLRLLKALGIRVACMRNKTIQAAFDRITNLNIAFQYRKQQPYLACIKSTFLFPTSGIAQIRT